MHKQIKNIFSLFLLFLFIFPLIEKEVHDFECTTDVHCTASEIHFHNLEHHCDICDFTITDSNGIPSTDVSFVISAQNFSYSELISRLSIPHVHSNLPSRAPPIA